MALKSDRENSLAAPPKLGATIQAVRTRQKLSMDAVSKLSGVSKSMLSQIERNLTNPTVAVVWKLANALNVGVAELLTLENPSQSSPALDLLPSHSTPVIRSADTSCELRILGPVPLAGKFEWYELIFQPGGAIHSEPHEKGAKEHLTVLSGQLVVKTGLIEQRLKRGDTARYSVDVKHSILNPGRGSSTALMVIEYLGDTDS